MRLSTKPGEARRRLGLGLMAWGVVGLLVLGVALGSVTGALGGPGPFAIEQQRLQLVRMLDASTGALAGAATAARNADDSLVSAAGAAASAGGFMAELSGTMRELASSLRISILGSQPFAQPAEDFERVAASADRVALDLEAAATGIRLGGEDMAALADELTRLQDEVNRMREGLGGPLDLAAWRLLAIVLIAWLAIPAVISLLVGYRWWRRDVRSGSRPPGGRATRA